MCAMHGVEGEILFAELVVKLRCYRDAVETHRIPIVLIKVLPGNSGDHLGDLFRYGCGH